MSKEVEPYYDSDEGIAWGPLTLKEIKDELRQKTKNVKERRTDFGHFNYSTGLDKSTTSPTQSAYFTPDESLQPQPNVNKNEVFLEKLSRAIDDDSDSSYGTACDSTKLTKLENDTILRILNSPNMCNLDSIHQTLVANSPVEGNSYSEPDSIIEISDSSSDNLPEQHSCNESLLQIKEEEEESSGTEELMLELDHVKRKLAESYLKSDSSSCSQENEEWDVGNKLLEEIDNSIEPEENVSEVSSSSIEDLQIANEETEEQEVNHSFKDEIVKIQLESEDSDREEEEQLHQHQKNSSVSAKKLQNLSYRGDGDGEETEEQEVKHSFKDEIVKIQLLESEDSDREEEEQLHQHQKNSSVSAKKLQNLSCRGDGELSSTTDDIQERVNLMGLEDNKLNLSGVSFLSQDSHSTDDQSSSHLEVNAGFMVDPYTNSAPLEESLNKSDSFTFNDTIEEMEMALRQGLDYVMPGDEKPVTPQIHLNVDYHQPAKSNKKQILKTPTPGKYDYVQSFVGDYIRRKSPVPNNDNFKLPLKPLKSKLTPSRSPLVQAKGYKNIVSPVGTYIKNSPAMCLKKNVHAKTVPHLEIFPPTEAPKSNKENHSGGLPSIIYKPAKKVVTSEKKDIVLPLSLQKLVTEPRIMKHEKRFNHGNLNATSVDRKLLEDDLTYSENVDLNQTGDVSFVVNNQAFIK